MIKTNTPKTAEDFIDRGNAYYENSDYDLAFADYSQAIKLDPNSAGVYVLRSDVANCK